jgi:hypothetical protein
LFICRDIYSFSPDSPIVEYYSPKGNSGVPHPYAVDKENNAYLIGIDLGCKPTPLIPVIQEKRMDWSSKDPYEFYDFKAKKQAYTIKAKKVQNHKMN